jgi:hypothetical protein
MGITIVNIIVPQELFDLEWLFLTMMRTWDFSCLAPNSFSVDFQKFG